MPNLCANPLCRWNTPLPAGIPGDARAVPMWDDAVSSVRHVRRYAHPDPCGGSIYLCACCQRAVELVQGEERPAK